MKQNPSYLTGPQIIKKYPAFYATRRLITAFPSALHLSLSWARATQSMLPHLTSWSSILILYSYLCLGLPSGLRCLCIQVQGIVKCFPTHWIFQWGFVCTSSNLQAGGTSPNGCPKHLIHYIRSFPPYPEAVPPSASWRLAMVWWHGPTSWQFKLSHIKIWFSNMS